jgi:hypothetical protein
VEVRTQELKDSWETPIPLRRRVGWRPARRFSAALAVALLYACGGGGGGGGFSSAPATPGSIQQPAALNLYPESSAADSNRLFTAAVNMPLAFDTGSAGITLYAPDIFPASMVGAGGFVFASGQSSLTYQGITVTNQSGTRRFGSTATGKTQTGNIGFAQVTFGDSGGTLRTASMPVFLYYLITDNSTGQSVPVPHQRGWFGVSDAPNLITITGSLEPVTGFPACASGIQGSCYVASVFKYLSYGSGVNAGFSLSPAALQPCDISVSGDCAPSPLLTVGLNDSIKSGFSTVTLTCPPSNYRGPDMIDGYAVCQMGIPSTTVTVSGSAAGMLAGTVLFDSGTPSMVLNVPAGAVFPASVPSGNTVLVQTPSGFSFSYTAGTASQVTNTLVQQNSTAESIIGIGYFTTNSFFIDFTAGTEGWK